MHILEIESHLKLKLEEEITAKFQQVVVRGDGTILLVD